MMAGVTESTKRCEGCQGPVDAADARWCRWGCREWFETKGDVRAYKRACEERRAAQPSDFNSNA